MHLGSNLDQAGERLGSVDALDGGRRDVLPSAHLVLCEQLSVTVRRPAHRQLDVFGTQSCFHMHRDISQQIILPPVRSDVIVWGGDARGGRQRAGGEGAAC